MKRVRGERMKPHDVRCRCGVFVPAETAECLHMFGSHGPHRRIHLDEVCELLGWGESIESVATRLGVRVASIERAMYRHGTDEERAVIRRAMSMLGRHRDRRADAA